LNGSLDDAASLAIVSNGDLALVAS